jgi:fumarate reductase iron-sulfur subunit
MADKPIISVEVFRYHPDHDSGPTFQSYDVPYHDDWVVLDALNWIKDHTDGTLTYRWSCRMGVCGSCGMMVNSEPKLTCATFLKDYFPGAIRIEPLVNFPVERDLVVTFDDFLTKLEAVKPYIVRDDVDDTSRGEFKQSPAQLARYKQYTMCINCMLCYSACPVVDHEPNFLGPAALALGHRYNQDSRDKGTAERLEKMMDHEALWDCTFVGECTKVCPKNVDPAGAIQQAKAAAAQHYYRRWIMPKGTGR